MHLLRLAYTTQFLIALIAVFVLWSEVGGQSHLDLMPWYLKLALGGGAAFAAMKATVAAVGREKPWNGQCLRWLGVMIALLVCCGLASYYAHLNEDTDESDQPEAGALSSEVHPQPAPFERGGTPNRPYIRARSDSARRLALSAPTSATTMRSPS
jgi:hypothetical protein